jgi:hypothetical protein
LGEADDVEAAGLFAEVVLVDEEGADGVDLDVDVDNGGAAEAAVFGFFSMVGCVEDFEE